MVTQTISTNFMFQYKPEKEPKLFHKLSNLKIARFGLITMKVNFTDDSGNLRLHSPHYILFHIPQILLNKFIYIFTVFNDNLP